LELAVPNSVTSAQLANLLTAGISACDEVAEEDAAAGEAKEEATTTQTIPFKQQQLSWLESDVSRGVDQASCLQQWHGDVCGHHALFSVRCHLLGKPTALNDERLFWANTLKNIKELAHHGENTKRWPRSRVTSGVADEVHLLHLVESDDQLRGRVAVLQNVESLRRQLDAPNSDLQKGLDDLVMGRSQAFGFLLGATQHWYAAVALRANAPSISSCNGSAARVQLIFCDSHNKPLAKLRSADQVDALTDVYIEKHLGRKRKLLLEQPEWQHRPRLHVNQALEDGIEEWWKGSTRSSLFWRFRPKALQRVVIKEELDNVRDYLEVLTKALHPVAPNGSTL